MNIDVSIIIPCRNEEKYIKSCLISVLNFKDIQKISNEIIIIDGESTDSTVDIINDFINSNSLNTIKVIKNPDKFQAVGLNLGITEAKGDYILRLDAHSIYPEEYLSKLLETAKRTDAENVGGLVITKPYNSSYKAQIVQAVTTHKFGVGNSGFRVGAKEGEVDTVPYGFFKKEVFQKNGLFNTLLIRGQDYEFNRRIKHNGGKIWLNPDIVLDYYNQPNMSKFLKKQFYKEAPYNVYMWYLAPYTFAYRHSITGVFAISVIIGLVLSFFFNWARLLFLVVMGIYFLLAFLSAFQQAVRYKKVLHIFTLPVSFFLYHFIHGLGIWVGITKLLFKISPVQKKNK